MSSSGSVGRDATLRLFCALELPLRTRTSIAAWADGHLTSGRRVRDDDLHVTLVFLGATPERALETVIAALTDIAEATVAGPLTITGWRETRSVGMLVLRDATDWAIRFQKDLEQRLVEAGLTRAEQRRWLPHVTVLRHRGEGGSRPATLPADRTFVPSDAAAYLSRLHPSGARYEALARVPLASTTPGGVRNEA